MPPRELATAKGDDIDAGCLATIGPNPMSLGNAEGSPREAVSENTLGLSVFRSSSFLASLAVWCWVLLAIMLVSKL